MAKIIRLVKPATPPQHVRPNLKPMARRVGHYDPFVLIGLGVVVLALLGFIVYLNLNL